MRKFKEFIIEKLILLCGVASIIFVALIFVFLMKEGLAVFKAVSLKGFLFGKQWYPISEPPQLGIFPLILGSIWVTLGAALALVRQNVQILRVHDVAAVRQALLLFEAAGGL